MRMVRQGILRIAAAAAAGTLALNAASGATPMELHAPPPLKTSKQAERVLERHLPRLREEFAERGLRFGAPIYIRGFKEERELELWVEGADSTYRLFRKYEVCGLSGSLGPKLREGDRQTPEGFYVTTPEDLVPNSPFHMAFLVNFPNGFDRAHRRTGSLIEIHGGCISIGCYAMTDEIMEEIYAIAVAYLRADPDQFPVHLFPFRMTDANMARHEGNTWHDFWTMIRPGYTLFEAEGRPPLVDIEGRSYHFRSNVPCGRIPCADR